MSVGTMNSRFARIRSAGGNARNIIAIPTGTSTPPPIPCTARSATSSGSDVAVPHSADAAVNSPIEPSSTLLAPNRSPTHPDAGIATASATRYAVATPLTDAAGTAKYRLSVGSATFTTVASMMFRNIAATYTAPTTALAGIATFTVYYKIARVRRVPCGGFGAVGHRPRKRRAVGHRPRKGGGARRGAGAPGPRRVAGDAGGPCDGSRPASRAGRERLPAMAQAELAEPPAGHEQADQADGDKDAHVGPPLGGGVGP